MHSPSKPILYPSVRKNYTHPSFSHQLLLVPTSSVYIKESREKLKFYRLYSKHELPGVLVNLAKMNCSHFSMKMVTDDMRGRVLIMSLFQFFYAIRH